MNEQIRTSLSRRALALLLCLCLCFTMLPANVLAAEPTDAAAKRVNQGEQPETLTTADGDISVEEDWNEVYPYGTFAFGTHQADVGESGSKTKDGKEIPQTILIPVYRLGGTVGKVTAKITYAPAVTTQADGTGSVYDYAASGRQDLLIEYENPNPIAAYQDLGVPMAERRMTAAEASIVVPEAPEGTKNEDELKLTLSESAESYRWQVKQHGTWQDIRDANEAELTLTWGDLWNFESGTWSGLDFRCILGNEGVLTCTESMMGEVFEPLSETPAVPENLDPDAEPGYTELIFDEDYAVYRFELTFADGETVKYVRVTALDDELSELPELGLFTIAACEGGQLSDMCNTLTLMVSDNDKGEPSELGFAAEQVDVSRADNVARVKVTRTGGKSYNVTVHYETVDGTAKAGVDYAKKEGDLAFAGSIDEIEIPIELINNDDTSEKSFDLILTELRGGGMEELCKLTSERVTVTISGKSPEKKPDGSGQNLASLLAGADGEDVSAQVQQGEDALIGRSEDAAVRGHSNLPEGEHLYATVEIPEPNRMHTVNPHLHFTRESLASNYGASNYWGEYETALGGSYVEGESKNCMNYATKLAATTYGQGNIAVNRNMGEWEYTIDVEGEGQIPASVDNYCRITATHKAIAQMGINKAGTLFDYYLFATRLNSLGTASGKRYIRPTIEFSSTASGNQDAIEFGYGEKGETDRYYYAYSIHAANAGDPDNPEGWNGMYQYGDDPKKDKWGGMGMVEGVPLKWNAIANFFAYFNSCEQWKDKEKDGDASTNGTSVDVLTWSFHRRVFTTTRYNPREDTGGIGVVVYTANDDNEAGAYTPITGDKFYNDILPTISIVENAGGVSFRNELFVGSKLCIDASNIVGYTIPNNGLFMTNQNGEKVGTVTRNDDVWYIEMLWNGMKKSALNDTYQLNIILERTQTLKVDINPSTPRKEDGTVDTTKYDDAWTKFISRTIKPKLYTAALRADSDGVLTPTTENGKPDYFQDQERDLAKGDFDNGNRGVYTLSAGQTNIQAVNFNQDPEDVILYNGRAYAGNDTIPICQADMTQDSMIFIFYDSEYLDAVSDMEVFIDHVELYYDTDGIFENKEDDEFIGLVEGDYPDSLFKPYKDAADIVHQYYFRVHLTMRPRAYLVPAGADPDAKAQFLPAFISAVTDPDAAAELTDEQRSFRYIQADNTDDHFMYGGRANKPTYIDIPLGGDVGKKSYHTQTVYTWDDGTVMTPPEDGLPSTVIPSSSDDMKKIVDSDTVTVYSWEPEYTGQLLVPFEDPTPIVDDNNITGGSVAIAGETPQMNDDGTYSYSKRGKERVNANLGSFSGRTTFAIGVQEQVKPTRSTRNQSGIDSMDDIKPETITMGTVGATPNNDELLNMQSGGDPGDTSGTGPGEDVGAKEFAPDLGTSLPSLEFELGDYVTIVMDGYEVGFAIGIPVYQYEDTNYSGSESTTNNTSDGSTTTTKKDENGNTVRENTKTEKGVTTKTTTTTPPYPDGRGFINQTTVTETTDASGKTTKTTTTTTYYKNNWQDEKEPRTKCYSSTQSDQPPTEPTRSEKAEQGFKDANGGMATLKEFVKALTSPKKGSMSKFFDGFFDDEGLNNAKNGNTTSQKVQVTFKIQISIMFEYNPIDNCHYFKTAGLAGTLGFEFTLQHRFSFCPLIYVYLKIGVEVELKVSMTVLRKAKEGAEIKSFEQGSLEGMSQGKAVVFALDMRKKPVDAEAGLPPDANTARGFHLDLQGKVYMEVFENKDCTGDVLASGMLSGDGGTKEVLYEAYDKIVYVRLTPKKNQTVIASNLKPVIGATSKTVFDGLTITPGLSLEVGAGIGIDVLKFEIFIRTSVSISMTMGGYLEETESYEGFYISGFEWTLAAGFHLTILFFNYSMDAIAIGVEGAQHGTGGYFNWDISATAVDGNFTLWEKSTYTSADGKSLPGEPEPPTGFNFFKDNDACTFYNANGSKTDVSDKPAVDQDWSFSENVRAHRWSGGKFKGEIPMNADLAVSKANGAKLSFTTTEDEIWVYFSGTVKIASNDLGEEKTYKKSPAKLKFKSGGTHTVNVTANKSAKLDRFETPPSKDDDSAGKIALRARAKAQSLVHVTAPTDVSGTMTIHKPSEDSRAISPTGMEDFQLSGYNCSGDARKLVDGLTVGYDYKLVQVGKENYLIYPVMPKPNQPPQLALSRLVMTGNYAENSGLVHPLDKNSDTPYLLLDDDGLTDLDYSAEAGDDSIRVVWVSYADDKEETYTVRSRTISLLPDAQPTAIVSAEPTENFCSLTATACGEDLWVSAKGYGDQENELLKAWILARNQNLTEADLKNLTASDGSEAAAIYTWAVLSALNDLHGSGSVLCTAEGREAEIPGEAVENLKAFELNGMTLLLYSTAKTAYFNESDEGFTTVGADHLDEITEETERGVIRRLYLRSLDENGFGTAKLLQTVIDFEGCTEDNLDAAVLKDGIYENNAIRSAQADPYFANLRFLEADLGRKGDEGDEADESAETFALFEMGGNTWMLRQNDLETVLSGSGTVTLTPIFSETTGTDVCIGSDGDNLAVVYTAPVADSLSNAIFVAWWDKSLNNEQGGWGTPTILAMRDLQIYEDRVTYAMSGEDAEQAYLGKLSTPSGYTGSMNRMTFSNLQMSTRAISTKSDTKHQLIILTQGALTALQEKTFVREGKEDFTTVVPTEKTATVAFYAIAFGAGEQSLGEARLGLSEYDFTAGNRLIGQVEFTNTGTVSVRASNNNPITARLMASFPDGSESEQLAVWSLTTPIASGAKTVLTFHALPLTRNLPAGTVLSLELSEDGSYFQSNTFYAVLDDLLTVENKPELSISDFDMRFLRVRKTEAGDIVADYSLSLSVGNSGTAIADGVFLQFSYNTGEKDELGNEIYKPIDITGSNLVTSKPNQRGTEPTPEQLGIYYLKDGSETDNGSLAPNFYRTVSGATPGESGLLCVPASCFCSEENFSGLHLKVEVFSASDLDKANLLYGVYSSDHNEYNPVNNRVEQTFKHQTTFDVPSRINTALGTTLTLPVKFASSGAKPDLVLTETSDGTDGWEPRMGVCYYDPDRQVIVAAPNAKAQAMLEAGQKPTGILQIKDQSTNTIAAIAYTIGDMADGVNIYKDDASFTYYNSDGKPTNVNAPLSSNPGWRFVPWGDAATWTCGKVGDIPMNYDLSVANQDGAYLTFETVADTMTIYYVGEIRVSSSEFGNYGPFGIEYYTDPETNPPTTKPAEIRFDNPNGLLHTVTIRAAKGTMIDRYVATYKTNTVPDTDPDAPQILWNRSFPDTASLLPGSSVPMTCYIIDASGLQSVRFNGRELTESTTPKLVKLDENLWYFDYTFTENCSYQVRAFDNAGNSSGGSFNVSWFNDVLSAGAISGAPGLVRNDLSFVDQTGAAVNTETGTITTPPWLKSAYAPTADESSSAYLFYDGVMSDAALEKEANGEQWRANWNGVYMVRVDRNDGTWARAVIKIKNLDLSTSVDQNPILSVTAGKNSIGITASDDVGLKTLTVNGYAIAVSGNLYSGAFPVSCSGSYTVSLTDSAGHTVTKTVEITIPLTLLDGLVSQSFSCANNMLKGSVTADPGAITGGAYDTGVSNPANNVYHAVYSAALVSAGSVPQDADYVTLGDTAYTFEDLEPGDYALYVRDSAGSELLWEESIQVAHPEFEWSEPSYDWSDDYGTVTASRFCSLDATHKETETVTTTHNIAQMPTCTGRGKTTYVANFTNPAFVQQSKTVADIDPIGHSYKLTGWTWTGYTAAIAIFTCENNPNHVENISAVITAERTEPSCEETGEVVYTATVRFEGKDHKDTKTETLPAAGHDWQKATYLWAEDFSEVTATRICKTDNSHTQTEKGKITSAVTKEATYNAEGELTYTAVFTNPAFATQTRKVAIPKLQFKPCSGDDCPGRRFTDMPPKNHWAHDAIDWALLKNLTAGTSATRFGPNDGCTRAQYITFLWRLAGSPEPTTSQNPFKDVPAGKYYTKAVLWAYGKRIAGGTSANTFSPMDPCTRAMAMTFLWRLAGSPEPTTNKNPFTDVSTGKYYTKAVLWAYGNKITGGTTKTTFSPNKNCTRAQALTFLYRYSKE